MTGLPPTLALAALLLLAEPFWEALPPHAWSDDQLRLMLQDSPWAQPAVAHRAEDISTFLASSKPMQMAEIEFRRRTKQPIRGGSFTEFLIYLEDNPGKSIVLAIPYDDWTKMSDAEESRLMVEKTYLKVGKKKYAMEGHFPPGPSDKFLRMIFPRKVSPDDKALEFELYLPGMPSSFRHVRYPLDRMMFKGSLEM